jgi:bifunctional UDP-N-acetylglucosamine pyrophosphorylase/glucosamine-1-phosphate N-acetyltransferase
MLDHVIKSALEAGVDDITAVINPAHEVFLRSGEFREKVSVAHQAIPKGTGDGARCGAVNIKSSASEFAYLLYADIPLISSDTLKKLARLAGECERTAVVVVAQAQDAADSSALGKLEPADAEGFLKSIIESQDSDLAATPACFLPFCNAGLLVRKDLLLDFLEKLVPSPATGELYVTGIVEYAYNAGYLCRYHVADAEELLGANTCADFAMLEKNFQQRMRKKHLDAGVIMRAPETVFFSFDTVIEHDVIINPYVVFGRHVHLKRGSIIESFCSIDGSEVEAATIGPFARLRSGSKIHAGARIGNFVEIKNSDIAEKTKVNHLSYVGDSDVGEGCNIGAGVITCNYDGFQKHRTSIEKNVFVGSNAALVAPLRIQANAIVAAGSIITDSVEPDTLAIARSRQKNISDGAVNFRNKKNKAKEKTCAE